MGSAGLQKGKQVKEKHHARYVDTEGKSDAQGAGVAG
jgi:hypothetical protein